ncbi:MAG: MFS transporter [Candidatus Dormibacteria bacterium]
MAELEVLEDTTAAAAPRAPVPSPRERSLGISPQMRGWVPPPPSEAAPPPPTWRGRAGTAVGQLNPWQVAGGINVAPLVIVGVLSLIGNADYQALFVLIPQMQPSFGYNLAFLAVFNGLLNLTAALLAPAVGWVADRWPRVWLLRVGGLVFHGGSVLMGLSGSAGALLGARAVQSTGQAVQGPATWPLLADLYPASHRGRVFAFVMQCGTIGTIVITPVIGVIADAGGWQMAFIVFGLLSMALTGLYFLVREPVRGQMDRLAAGASADVAAREQAPVGWRESWRAVSSIGTVRRLWYAQPFLAVAGFTSLILPIYLTETWHVSAAGLGLILSAQAVAVLVGQWITGPLVDRLLADRPARILSLVAGIAVLKALSLVAVAFAPNLAAAILATCLAAAFASLITPQFSPPILGLMSLVVPARVRAFGIQSLAPWALLATPIIYAGANYFQSAGLTPGLRLLPFVPFYVIGAAVMLTGGLSVERDIRSAIATSLADEEARKAREAGRAKLLVVRGLDVDYDGAQVLFGVDLDVAEGEIVALLGTNGAGKSTVLRAICGVQEASAGAVFFDGTDITHSPPHVNARSGIVMMPGGHAIFPSLSVRENLRAALTAAGEEDGDRLEQVLELFPQLRERLSTAAGELSGGEQQMVALSQALLMRPKLLMIDELSLGLAPQVVDQLLEVVRRISAQGTTLVLVEQSVNVALTIADRALFMEKGEIIFEGDARELLTRGDLVRSTFLGNTRASTRFGSGRAAGQLVEEPTEVLRLESATVEYGGVRALDRVSLHVMSDEVLGIIGPNGAGKTTLFDAISGFTPLSEGRVTLFGVDATALAPDARAKLGLTRSFQNVRLFGAMSVRETIATALELHLTSRSAVAAALWLPPARRSSRRVQRRVDNLIDSLGLRRYAESFVNELSTGTRRIVDLACLLAAAPKLLLLDEPSSGLAQSETEELGPLIARIATETGCAILVIEHDLPLVSAVCTRMLAMDRGVTLATGDPRDVLLDPQVVRSYLRASDDVINRSGLVRDDRGRALDPAGSTT